MPGDDVNDMGAAEAVLASFSGLLCKNLQILSTSVLIILLAPFSVVSHMISPSRSREVAPSTNIPLLAWMQSSGFWIQWSRFCHWCVIKNFVHGMENGERTKLVYVTTACQWAASV